MSGVSKLDGVEIVRERHLCTLDQLPSIVTVIMNGVSTSDIVSEKDV
jgi:hypothetical protein